MEISTKTIPLDGGRQVTFRPTTAEDEPFLLEVYGSTRADELALTNWSAAQREAFLQMQLTSQHAHYHQYYPRGEYLLILLDGRPAGRLYVAEIAEEVRLMDVTLLPGARDARIGTPIIKALMAEAAALNKPLRIYVENYNRSHGLFTRLGFVKIGESGYSDFLEWRAPTSDALTAT